ncbi:MAG: MFS transporter [Balneolaceae bacterium]
MTSSATNRSLFNESDLYIIFGVTLTSVMGVSSVAPAFPSIAKALNVSSSQIGLLITFFTLPGIFFTPFLGILADRFSRKIILIPSLFLFGLAGTACAFATSFEQLLFFRVLQGTGGAALGVLNLTLIGDLYSGNQRAAVMGYNGSVLSMGTAIYPAIGGALAIFGWNYPFFLSLIAIPVGLFTIFFLRNKKVHIGLDLNLYLKQIRTALMSRAVLGLFLAMFLTCIILYGGYITFFTILLDEKFGKSSLAIGLILSGSSFVTAVTSARIGKLTQWFSEKKLITGAAMLYVIVFLMIPFIENIWHFILPIGLFGLALGINIPSVLNLLTGYAPMEFRAAFLSVNWLLMRTGQALGPYLLGLVYLHVSLEGTFYVTALAGVLFVLNSLTLIQSGEPKESGDATTGVV